jgi:hypothetical protein
MSERSMMLSLSDFGSLWVGVLLLTRLNLELARRVSRIEPFLLLEVQYQFLEWLLRSPLRMKGRSLSRSSKRFCHRKASVTDFLGGTYIAIIWRVLYWVVTLTRTSSRL